MLHGTFLFLKYFFFSYKCKHNLFILSFWTSYAIFVNADSWKKRAVENFHLNCVNNCDKRHLERSAVFPLYLLLSLSFFLFTPPLSLLSLHPHSMTSNPKYLSDEFCCRFFFLQVKSVLCYPWSFYLRVFQFILFTAKNKNVLQLCSPHIFFFLLTF